MTMGRTRQLAVSSSAATSNAPVTTAHAAISYEQQLDRDARWALAEGSRHFDEKSKVFEALHRICDRLQGLNVPFAVVGGMALFRHGFRRFTEDVDLLVTRADLKRIHEKLSGLGYLPPHGSSKHLRDTELGVRIEFLTSGDFPGDGKPKPVSFPDPDSEIVVELDGMPVLVLPKLIELKLASGMTNPGRMKDLADVQELIKLRRLPADFAGQLHPYVRDKFRELWQGGQSRYVALWPKEVAPGSEATFDAMQRDGILVEALESDPNHVLLVTTDPEIAERYDMVDELSFWHAENAD